MRVILAILFVLGSQLPARGDDVGEAIARAEKNFKAGAYADAMLVLHQALAQKKGKEKRLSDAIGSMSARIEKQISITAGDIYGPDLKREWGKLEKQEAETRRQAKYAAEYKFPANIKHAKKLITEYQAAVKDYDRMRDKAVAMEKDISRAITLVNAGQCDKAEAILSQIEKQDSRLTIIRKVRANIQLRRGAELAEKKKYKEAIGYFKRSFELNPTRPAGGKKNPARLGLGHCYWNIGWEFPKSKKDERKRCWSEGTKYIPENEKLADLAKYGASKRERMDEVLFDIMVEAGKRRQYTETRTEIIAAYLSQHNLDSDGGLRLAKKALEGTRCWEAYQAHARSLLLLGKDPADTLKAMGVNEPRFVDPGAAKREARRQYLFAEAALVNCRKDPKRSQEHLRTALFRLREALCLDHESLLYRNRVKEVNELLKNRIPDRKLATLYYQNAERLLGRDEIQAARKACGRSLSAKESVEAHILLAKIAAGQKDSRTSADEAVLAMQAVKKGQLLEANDTDSLAQTMALAKLAYASACVAQAGQSDKPRQYIEPAIDALVQACFATPRNEIITALLKRLREKIPDYKPDMEFHKKMAMEPIVPIVEPAQHGAGQ